MARFNYLKGVFGLLPTPYNEDYTIRTTDLRAAADFCCRSGQRRHRARMTERERHPHVDHIGDRQISFLARLLVEHGMRLGLQRQDRLSVDGAVESCEQCLDIGEESIDELGFVTAAGALGDHLLHGHKAMMVVQRDNLLRERHEPHRKLHRIARKATRQAFSVPALVDLAEIFTDPLG